MTASRIQGKWFGTPEDEDFACPDAAAAISFADLKQAMTHAPAPPSLRNAAAALLESFDPNALPPGSRILQKGRNLTVAVPVPECAGESVVVKRFPAPGLARRALMAISGQKPKATRSHRAAAFLHARLPGSTPEPLGMIEKVRPGGGPGVGMFATREVPGLESFTSRLASLYASHGPCRELMALLLRVATFCRALHDAGFFHGDLGNQNIQLAPDGRTLVLDLNRSRLFNAPLSNRLRARDLSRIALPSDFLRCFFEMYWGTPPPPDFLAAERRFRRRFALHSATRPLRHPFRRRPPSPEPKYPPERDIWIWDDKSEQAVAALRPRDRRRHQSASRVFLPALAIIRALPSLRLRLRRLRDMEFASPVLRLHERMFVSVSCEPDNFSRELDELSRLDPPGVHVRFYAHEDASTTDFKLDAAKRLRSLGMRLATSLVQDRQSVIDPRRWEAFCNKVLDGLDTAPADGTGVAGAASGIAWCEYLHAVNRVKWGFWNFKELRRSLMTLPKLRASHPGVHFLVPSVIDFEWDFLAAALRLVPRFVASGGGSGAAAPLGLSAELYVDRRGAPENKQGRHDAVDKLRLFRALSETPPALRGPRVVTEFNWPLAGTGEWSPVGSPYVSPGPRAPGDPSVGERAAADFAVRWFLLGTCSGHADAMCFWSLASHGFGLVDSGTASGDAWRERPAFENLRFLFRVARSADFADAPLRGVGSRRLWLLRFIGHNGKRAAAAWVASGDTAPPIDHAELGFEPSLVCDSCGTPVLPLLPLSGSPLWFFE